MNRALVSILGLAGLFAAALYFELVNFTVGAIVFIVGTNLIARKHQARPENVFADNAATGASEEDKNAVPKPRVGWHLALFLATPVIGFTAGGYFLLRMTERYPDAGWLTPALPFLALAVAFVSATLLAVVLPARCPSTSCGARAMFISHVLPSITYECKRCHHEYVTSIQLGKTERKLDNLP